MFPPSPPEPCWCVGVCVSSGSALTKESWKRGPTSRSLSGKTFGKQIWTIEKAKNVWLEWIMEDLGLKEQRFPLKAFKSGSLYYSSQETPKKHQEGQHLAAIFWTLSHCPQNGDGGAMFVMPLFAHWHTRPAKDVQGVGFLCCTCRDIQWWNSMAHRPFRKILSAKRRAAFCCFKKKKQNKKHFGLTKLSDGQTQDVDMQPKEHFRHLPSGIIRNATY